MTWSWSHAVLPIFVRNFVQICLEAPGNGSFRKKKKAKKMSSSFWNAWLLLTSLKACDCSGHIVGGSASPTSLTKKLAICHPLPLFMAVSMIPNMWPSSCDCMRHSWSATKFEVIRLNQLVVRVRRWRAGTGVLVWERSSFPGKWFANIFFPVARIFFFERSTYEDQEFQVPHKPARAGTMKSQGKPWLHERNGASAGTPGSKDV